MNLGPEPLKQTLQCEISTRPIRDRDRVQSFLYPRQRQHQPCSIRVAQEWRHGRRAVFGVRAHPPGSIFGSIVALQCAAPPSITLAGPQTSLGPHDSTSARCRCPELQPCPCSPDPVDHVELCTGSSFSNSCLSTVATRAKLVCVTGFLHGSCVASIGRPPASAPARMKGRGSCCYLGGWRTVTA